MDKSELLNLSRAKRATLNKVIADILDLEKSKNEAKKTPAKKSSKSGDLISGILDLENDDFEEEKPVKLIETKTKRRKTEQVNERFFHLIVKLSV